MTKTTPPAVCATVLLARHCEKTQIMTAKQSIIEVSVGALKSLTEAGLQGLYFGDRAPQMEQPFDRNHEHLL